jgi:hypothetical protein
MILSSQKF